MQSTAAEWYYIGHYGQLGPLTREQMEELIAGGVIAKETFVWRTGMTDWVPAERMGELRPMFEQIEPYLLPPPTPTKSAPPLAPTGGMGSWRSDAIAPASNNYPAYGGIRSDRSRVLAGILNLLFPGVGRIYLGHAAHGVLQLVLFFCGGIGWIWSFVDGIIILSGGVKYDGYGRVLAD